MLRRFAFRADATEILLAIASAVAVAGATLFIVLFALLGSGRLAGTPSLTLPAGATGGVLTAGGAVALVMALVLWLYSGRADRNAARLLRATYALGLALVIGWWIGTLGFAVLLWLAA